MKKSPFFKKKPSGKEEGKKEKSKKSFELAISTLIILVLAILVLVVLLVAFTGSWSKFWNTIKEYFVSDTEAVKSACENACSSGLNYDFCCRERQVDFGHGKEKITCQDSRLKVECEINCENACD